MLYRVIVLPSGMRFNAEERVEFLPLVNNARKEAKIAAFSPSMDRNIRHIVYVGERRRNAELTDIRIFEQPKLLADEAFFRHVEELKPDYVGAIHINHNGAQSVTIVNS